MYLSFKSSVVHAGFYGPQNNSTYPFSVIPSQKSHILSTRSQPSLIQVQFMDGNPSRYKWVWSLQRLVALSQREAWSLLLHRRLASTYYHEKITNANSHLHYHIAIKERKWLTQQITKKAHTHLCLETSTVDYKTGVKLGATTSEENMAL